MKRVLILTVTAGNGHNAAANSMKNRLEKEDDVEVKVVDIFKEYSNKLNTWLVDGGYLLSLKYLRPVYNFFYDSYMKWPVKKALVCPTQASVNDVSGKLLKCIYDFKPDVIYGTSFYCGIVLANLRRVFKLPSFNVSCMLDYVVSPFWEAAADGLDVLTLSDDQFRQTLIDKGFKDSQLLTTGIPVNEKFFGEIDKNDAREKLGLEKGLFTILIFFGGDAKQEGFAVFKRILKHIKTKAQVVIINGRDEKTKKKIDKKIKNVPQNFVIKNVGFTKEVDLFLSACDIMIGKGGGLCTTECICKGIPLIATCKLASQEVYNVKFLKEKGLALAYKTKKELLKNVDFLAAHPEEIERMHDGMIAIRKNANEKIAQLILSQPKADYSKVNVTINFKKVDGVVKKARKKEYKRRIKELKNKSGN